ncbi:MAG: DUF3299 domain-containing protein [Hyphomicrobiaceae bacterium]
MMGCFFSLGFMSGGHGPGRRGRRVCSGLAVSALLVVMALAGNAPAWAKQVQVLTLAQLIPDSARAQPKKKKLRSFLAGRTAPNTDESLIPEGRWLSPGGQSQAPEGRGPGTVVEALDGRYVKIGGYVVPLDFDATRVKEFLLVPFVGACIHVPPPPANQIIYVKSAKGFEVKGMFDPVWVTGRLAAKAAFTGLAETGYSLTADKIEGRAQ